MRGRGRWFLLFALVVLGLVAVAGLSAAPDRRAPRMVAAVVVDANRDFRADRVRLTFSERIRHPRDTDGRYPFTVAGYRVSSVAAARGKSLVIVLVEKGSVDAAARPAVRYRRTVSQPVRDRAGNQARAQVFRGTRSHGRVPSVPPPGTPPPPPTQPPATLDPDGDGYAAPADCQPNDRAINPGAADLPDLAFVDSNCDLIDGTEANAIFVSPTGNDANLGTKAAPKREISTAVAAAAVAKRYVLAAAGTYGRVVAASDVAIYGGYDPTLWSRNAAQITLIAGRPEGVLATAATGVLLQLVTVTGQNLGSSAYGIRAIDGSSLTLQGVTVTAGAGAPGAPGADGRAGDAGEDGQGGVNGGCSGYEGPAPGGRGGDSPVGRTGGKGGDGGRRGSNSGQAGAEGKFGTPGGAGGKGGNPGKPGANGQDGSTGTPGVTGQGGGNSATLASAIWRGQSAGSGGFGLSGNGGGGGGGGGGKGGLFVFDCAGNAGAGGGGGGGPGRPGDGGRFGGGSFGVYLFNATIVIESSSITAGNGGPGGRGGNGGPGGIGGGSGIPGANSSPGDVGRGGRGGIGGRGGSGGGGGGGAGGPSIAVMKVGSAATLTDTKVAFGTAGPGGVPGTGGSGTAASQPGIAQAIFP